MLIWSLKDRLCSLTDQVTYLYYYILRLKSIRPRLGDINANLTFCYESWEMGIVPYWWGNLLVLLYTKTRTHQTPPGGIKANLTCWYNAQEMGVLYGWPGCLLVLLNVLTWTHQTLLGEWKSYSSMLIERLGDEWWFLVDQTTHETIISTILLIVYIYY
jgi:hypothetical protein